MREKPTLLKCPERWVCLSFLCLFQGLSSVSPLDLLWWRRMPSYHICPVCCRGSVRTLPCDLLFWQVGTSRYVVPRASSWCPYPVLSPLLTLSHFSTERVTLEQCEHLGGHAFSRGWYCNSKKHSSYTWSTAIHTLNNLWCCAANISWWGEKGNVKWVLWRRLITGMGWDSVEIKLEIHLVQE